MRSKALKIKRNRFPYVKLGLFQSISLGMATGQGRNKRNVPSLGDGFIEN